MGYMKIKMWWKREEERKEEILIEETWVLNERMIFWSIFFLNNYIVIRMK